MKIGDRVKFLNDVGGGIITRFLEPDKVLVRIEEGFEVPSMLNQLILDNADKTNPYPNGRNIQEDQYSEEEIIISGSEEDPAVELKPEEKNTETVYLAFTREGNPFNLITCLINDTNYYIYYVLGIRKMELQLYKYSGFLEPNTKIILGSFKIVSPDEPTIFSVQYISYKKGYYEPIEPVNHILEINTRKLVGSEYEDENDFFDMPASLFPIHADDPSDNGNHLNNSAFLNMITEKEGKVDQKTNVRQQKLPEIMEVDLHIHEIIEDQSGLTDGDILDIQLKRFETALETAILSKVNKVVFIHGVGQGRLKYEIAKILDNKYPDLKYQDASFKEYGYGATMVFL